MERECNTSASYLTPAAIVSIVVLIIVMKKTKSGRSLYA